MGDRGRRIGPGRQVRTNASTARSARSACNGTTAEWHHPEPARAADPGSRKRSVRSLQMMPRSRLPDPQCVGEMERWRIGPGRQVRTNATAADAARSTCNGAATESHQAEPRGAADPRRRVVHF